MGTVGCGHKSPLMSKRVSLNLIHLEITSALNDLGWVYVKWYLANKR